MGAPKREGGYSNGPKPPKIKLRCKKIINSRNSKIFFIPVILGTKRFLKYYNYRRNVTFQNYVLIYI